MLTEIDIINAVFGGFVSKLINDCVDKAKTFTTSSSINVNTNSQFYSIIIDALNSITYNKFRDSETLLNVAEEIFNGICKHGTNNSNFIRNALRNITTLTKYTDEDFKIAICKELAKNENQELFNTISIIIGLDTNVKITSNTETLNVLNNKIDQILSILEGNTNIVLDDSIKLFKNNKKRLYLNKWFSPLFLHVNDENPILLKDAFIMPDYTISTSINTIDNLKDSTLDNIIDKVISYPKTISLIIAGVPGIGKTTITSWIANKYILNNNLIILRFRDWSVDELSKGFLKAIQNTLCCDLENKILILDGFDENKILNRCDKLLSDFFCDIKDFDNLKVIITSRPTYFSKNNNFENLIQLLPFDNERIKSFCFKITKNKLNIQIPENNHDVYGIPVILYMVIMSDINISIPYTAFEIYKKIFSLKGGIFDKFSYNGTEYDIGSHALRNQNNISIYMEFLEDISFSMFEKNDLTLVKNEYILPKINYHGESTILDFPLKFLFDDSDYSIEFIHKTIYEYFLSEFIYNNIRDLYGKTNEQLAGIFGRLLKMNILPSEVIDNLRCKINDDRKLRDDNKKILDVFNLMLDDGMTYYTAICYKNALKCEKNVFINMLSIIHLWSLENYKQINGSIDKFLESNWMLNLNFLNFDLTKVKLTRADLANSNLDGANLTSAHLDNANLTNAKLTGAALIGTHLDCAHLNFAHLDGAHLDGAYLDGAYFIGANLDGAYFIGAYLTCANLTGANLIDTHLDGAHLDGAHLDGSNLNGAHLNGAYLTSANLSHADLTGADLAGAELNYTKLNYAVLIDADLTNTKFHNVELFGASFDEKNIFRVIDKCDLSNSLVYLEKSGKTITYNEFIKTITN